MTSTSVVLFSMSFMTSQQHCKQIIVVCHHFQPESEIRIRIIGYRRYELIYRCDLPKNIDIFGYIYHGRSNASNVRHARAGGETQTQQLRTFSIHGTCVVFSAVLRICFPACTCGMLRWIYRGRYIKNIDIFEQSTQKYLRYPIIRIRILLSGNLV